MISYIIKQFEQMDNVFNNDLYEAVENFRLHPTDDNRNKIIAIERRFKDLTRDFDQCLKDLYIGKKIK